MITEYDRWKTTDIDAEEREAAEDAGCDSVEQYRAMLAEQRAEAELERGLERLEEVRCE